MTQLRRDAAYIRTKSNERTTKARARLTDFDKEVCKVLQSAHTVTSVTKTMSSASDSDIDLEERVADSMLRLLQAERIQLSPDS